MRIVFGWNHFKIRSFQPYEIGMNPSEKYDFTIEARQKYFHLFWIPFLGIGKSWVIRKNGGKLYEVPLEIRPSLAAFEKDLKAPWYTFLGPLLLLLGGVGFWGYTEVDEYQSRVRTVENHERFVQNLRNQLTHLDTTDFITLAPGISGPVQYLKVEKIGPKEISFTVIEQQGDTYNEKMLDVEDNYVVGKKFYPTISISKDSLLRSIPKKVEDSYLISQSGIDLLGNGNKYIIKEIVRHFRPIIRDEGSGSYGGSISMELKSYGWPFEIISIKNSVGDIKWDPTLNGVLVERPDSHFGKTFYLRGDNYVYDAPYQFVLTIKDTTGRVFNFQIQGSNLKKTITEL